jgi:hypothetical protein
VFKRGQRQEQAAMYRLAAAPKSERKQRLQELRDVRNKEAIKLFDAQARPRMLHTGPAFLDRVLPTLARACSQIYRGTKAALTERIGEWEARWEGAGASPAGKVPISDQLVTIDGKSLREMLRKHRLRQNSFARVSEASISRLIRKTPVRQSTLDDLLAELREKGVPAATISKLQSSKSPS